MDYAAFYQEVVAWINEANQKATTLGLQSNDFWLWVTRSSGEICDKHGNNKLVINQMLMLINWLEDIYFGR
ncbi:hypothetical protein [Oceanobacillus sp. FSL H7-0719]|uniref:hypothetical protein n=1 Tax=Oceanobacillus sp. FSL H7-0719 TaxID=2954507 RepID=UPI0032499055